MDVLRVITVVLAVVGCAMSWADASAPDAARARQIVPQVRIHDDADFFAAWNLDYPGLEAAKAAVQAGDYAQAKIALKAYFRKRRQPKWHINHWEMPAQPQGSAQDSPDYELAEAIVAHRDASTNIYERRPGRVLGPLYWRTHDERYAKEFADEIADTVINWPPEEVYTNAAPWAWRRLASIVPLVGDWLDAYNYFLSSPSFTPEVNALMLKGFTERARFAVRNPEVVNRYLFQRQGIYNVGAHFPELKSAAGLRDFAVTSMLHGAEGLIYPDGTSKELCPGYHIDSVLRVRGVLDSATIMGYPLPTQLIPVIERMYDFLPQTATPLRTLVKFGDTPRARDIRGYLQDVLQYVDKPVYRWFASDGAEGTPPGFVSNRLPWAGFYFMRSGWDKRALFLAERAGPRGRDHWHEDNGTFELYAYGEPLLVEVGVYSYTWSKWTDFFRGTQAHNLVTVDGFTQNRAVDPTTSVTDHPRSNDWHSDSVFDMTWTLYDNKWADPQGYRTLPSEEQRAAAANLATHRRDIAFVKNSYFIVSDRLVSTGRHHYSQLFHFMPDRTAQVLGPDRAGTVDPARANIVMIQADPVPAQVIVGREDPAQGWYSDSHETRVPAPVVSFDQTARNRAYYDTVLLPLDAGQQPDMMVERVPVRDLLGGLVPAMDVCALRITTPSGVDLYVDDLRQQDIGPVNGQMKVIGDLRTDVRAAVVRMDREGNILAASSVGGTVLTWRGVDANLVGGRDVEE
jgi:hypothetical protein